ncbi:MAG: marine proteobacterial sortase target protein [Lysobacterales bacterium]|jgi:Ca-activated chloride channel family protein
MNRNPSIRDRLEHDAWRNHPDFAERCAEMRHPSPPRRGMRWQDRVLLILACTLALLLLVRIQTAQAATGPDYWGLELDDGQTTRLQVALATNIQARVTALSARVTVEQVFRNESGQWSEAVYRYPLPIGAAVDRLWVKAGQRLIEGEIREKTDARRQYRQARANGQLASLVEQQRPNQFVTRLANIAPGEEVRIRIGFLAPVEFRDGSFSLLLPMTFTPRYETSRKIVPPNGGLGRAPQPVLAGGTAAPGHRLSVDVELDTGLELARIESRYHDIDIHPRPGGYRVTLTDLEVRSDRAFELDWTPEYGAAPRSTLMTWDGGDAVYAMMMLAPPVPSAVAPTPREIVFVVDTSGSMEGQSLRQAKAALISGLEHLGANDRFNLVQFNSHAESLFEESRPPLPAAIEEAVDYIDALRANGGTEMAPAFDIALGQPPQPGLLRQIVFITDGSVGNEHELLQQIADQLGASRLFTVSIGSAPNGWFMRKAAEIGRGAHMRIGRIEEAAERMGALWSRIESPALQDISVDWGTQAEYYPEVVPDLYAGEPLWLFARLPRETGDIIVEGTLDGRHWESRAGAEPLAGGPDIAALWARSKLEALQDSRLFGTDPQVIRDESLRLALTFGLLTPYTSLVAVDRTPARPQGEALASTDVPSLTPAGSAVSSGFSQTATGWPMQLLLAGLSLFIATGLLLYSPSRARSAGGARRPMASAEP